MRFLTSTHPEHFHILTPPYRCTRMLVRAPLYRIDMYRIAKGPAQARKGNEACFQLSGIILLAVCIICLVIVNDVGETDIRSCETKE